jgi:transposase-like protein
MYVNGMGFRGIERVKNVHHTTIISWVKQVGKLLPSRRELARPRNRYSRVREKLGNA